MLADCEDAPVPPLPLIPTPAETVPDILPATLKPPLPPPPPSDCATIPNDESPSVKILPVLLTLTKFADPPSPPPPPSDTAPAAVPDKAPATENPPLPPLPPIDCAT